MSCELNLSVCMFVCVCRYGDSNLGGVRIPHIYVHAAKRLVRLLPNFTVHTRVPNMILFRIVYRHYHVNFYEIQRPHQ